MGQSLSDFHYMRCRKKNKNGKKCGGTIYPTIRAHIAKCSKCNEYISWAEIKKPN